MYVHCRPGHPALGGRDATVPARDSGAAGLPSIVKAQNIFILYFLRPQSISTFSACAFDPCMPDSREGSMRFSAYAVATAIVARALVIGLGSDYGFAGKSRTVVVKVSQASSQPVKMRYYGGPKSPMYP
jgi:hypothetical protein